MWAVVAPLLAISVYTFAFKTTLKLPMSERNVDPRIAYALFIFAGLIIYNFFSEMAYRAPMLLHEYAHYIKQTIFPSDLLAVISTLRAGVYILISLGTMLAFQLLTVHWIPWTVVLLPFVFVPLIAFLVGMSWFLCAIGAFTRDAGYVMINVVPLFMFATPVFFPNDSLSEPFRTLIYLNALTGYVEVLRDFVLIGQLPNMLVYGWIVLLSIVTFYFGYWFFDRYRNVIVDVI
jgi:lipopolysaccharide transport system permease protein